MKYVRVQFEFPQEFRHPMHQFAVEHDEVSDYQLLHGWPAPDGSATFLFQFEGEADAYRNAIDDVETVDVFQVTSGPGDTVYVYSQDSQEYAHGHTLTNTLESGLVAVLPIDFHTDGSATVSFVGPSGDIQAALDATSEHIDVTVETVTTYGAHVTEPGDSLTERQLEAVETAVDLGYYEPTRNASVTEIGAALGCSGSAAAEHLRRAEASVMKHVARR